MNLITVYRTFSIAEAQVVRSRLDAAGLHPEIANEVAAVSIDGYTQAAGGVQVQMPEEEAQAARELIDASQQAPA
jgi:hypothetical protein